MIITAIDTETTGLDINRHEIIQLGIIKYSFEEYGELNPIFKKEFNIKPINIKTASIEALNINGYTEQKWINSISFKDCFPILEEVFLHSDFLIGQNLIFDLKFINKEYWRYGFKMPDIPKYIDTKYMGEELVKEGKLSSSSMDKMCKHYNIKFNGIAHTALADCERTVMIWERLRKQVENKFFTFKEPYNAYKKINNARKIIR